MAANFHPKERETVMKSALEFARSLGFTALASLIVIWGSELVSLQAFHVGFFGGLVLAVVLAGLAWAFYIPIAIASVKLFSLKEPGILVFTAWGTISGALAIWLVGLFATDAVTVGNYLVALPYAFANTVMVWGVAYLFKSAGKDLKWLPERG